MKDSHLRFVKISLIYKFDKAINFSDSLNVLYINVFQVLPAKTNHFMLKRMKEYLIFRKVCHFGQLIIQKRDN